MKDKKWQEDIEEHLVNLHPVEIEEGIIKPAIQQLIDDYNVLIDKNDKDYVKSQKELVKFWKQIQKYIDKGKIRKQR